MQGRAGAVGCQRLTARGQLADSNGATIVTIHVVCACGKTLKAPDKMAGKSAKCPACQAPVFVPDEVAIMAAITTDDASPPYALPPGVDDPPPVMLDSPWAASQPQSPREPVHNNQVTGPKYRMLRMTAGVYRFLAAIDFIAFLVLFVTIPEDLAQRGVSDGGVLGVAFVIGLAGTLQIVVLIGMAEGIQLLLDMEDRLCATQKSVHSLS